MKHEVRLSSAVISPDGKQIVVVASRPDYDENRFVNQLYLIDCKSGETRPLTFDRPNVQQPQWSPDGNRIAFIAANKDEKRQVFVISRSGGEAEDVTKFKQDVGSFCWAPNGNAMAFTAAGATAEKDGEQKHNKSFEVTRNSFLADSVSSPIHLWSLELGQGEARQRTFGSESVVSPFGTPFDFSPDGRSLAYVARSSPESGHFRDLRLKSIELQTGKVSTLVAKPSMLALPRFSADGRLVSYMAPRGALLFSPFCMFTVPAAGGESLNAMPNLDRSATGAWLPNTQTLLLKGPELTSDAAWIQDLNGKPKRLNLGNVHIVGFERALSASNTGAIALVGATSGQPAEVYVLESTAGTPRKLTHFNRKFSSKRSGRVETITWECHDGLKANGVLVYPPDFKLGRKYPLVLDIHGGPMYRSTEAFSLWHQIMAAQGWIVFRPNYRGSDNQGRRFQEAIINDAGLGPGRDVMAGVAALKQLGVVDEQRMAVCGWSYGGFMTTWLTAHHHDFKAAVAGAPVTDWLDQYNLSDLNNWFGDGLGGSPWTKGNAKNYRQQSPLTYAQQIRTPMLIMSNTRDARVPITQSLKLYYALRDNKATVKFIAYPIDGHFPADPIHQQDVLKRRMDWIEKHFQE